MTQAPGGGGPRTVLITGASGGLGAALAGAYATPGRRLILGGRDAGRLEAVARAARTRGATAETAPVDVTDRAGVAAWINEADDGGPIDLAIANAGVSGGSSGALDPNEAARRIFRVNVDGVLNTVEPLVSRFTARRAGQIALMSSLASFRGLPNQPAYAASKAAVRLYGEGLRANLLGTGVSVTVVCPGFVRTPMTAHNTFSMPFLVEADNAAAIIRSGLDRRAPRIAFPWAFATLVKVAAALPAGTFDAYLARKTIGRRK